MDHKMQRIRALWITEDPDRPTTAQLVGLGLAGVDITVICPPEHRSAMVQAGLRVLDWPLRGRVDRSAVAALRAEITRGGYDILHVHGNEAVQNGVAASRGLPVKVVAYRGIVGNVSFFNPVSWQRFLNPRIDRIVCVAHAVRDYFLQMWPKFLRLPPEKLVTIHKGHSLDWYRATPVDLGSVGVPPGSFVVACVANYRPRKGIELLIDALAELPAEWQAHLLLIGADMDAPGLAKRIAASPVAANIHVLGFRQDAPALAAACDVFVLPSTKREGLSRSLIEAMAYGVVPVVTDCGGSTEVVADGVSGIVVPVCDVAALAAALKRLHDDPGLRHRMGEAARERIRSNFRIEDTIAKTLELYRNLVQTDARSGRAVSCESTRSFEPQSPDIR
jgi:glycosyltransferase involved in cell wall biosynthesis